MSLRITEKLLSYIWQFQLYNTSHLCTTEGEILLPIQKGLLNKHQGPDFLQATIQIGSTIWVGHVEIHVNSSDWNLHQHANDDRYKNVILHVVWNHDKVIDFPFSTIELKDRVPKLLLDKYSQLNDNQGFIPCESHFNEIDHIYMEKCKESMFMERLQNKIKKVESNLQENKGDWQETIWWSLAKSFGGHNNGDSFESIARSIPYRILLKNRHSLFQIESIIFGQSGLLKKYDDLPYISLMKSDYHHLRKKYSLSPPAIALDFLRMRPANFPSLRLAQLSSCIYHKGDSLINLVEIISMKEYQEFLNVQPSDFWTTHYSFKKISAPNKKPLGEGTQFSIIINAILPLSYTYALGNKNETSTYQVIDLFHQLKQEKNSIINRFLRLNIPIKSAFDSQALLELYQHYCIKKRCLQCAIGNAILKK